MNSIREICIETIKEEAVQNLAQEMTTLVVALASCGVEYGESVRAFKKRFLTHMLWMNGNNQCRTAKQLGMHRNTLSRLVHELGIELEPNKHGRRPLRSVPDVRNAARTA